ncbi:hypothetical protein B566_EDAN017295 [Ephemera danica]|nr:hypothetical protein B566_EDAN017295 [Ephemera danica]
MKYSMLTISLPGRGDRVICFYCGGGLKDWGVGDRAWVEHAVWFQNCQYLLLIKGPAFVEQVRALREAQSAQTEATEVSDDGVRACKVCFLKELGIVFLPCGHMATCPDCAPQLRSCPICRTVASAYIRAYLP